MNKKAVKIIISVLILSFSLGGIFVYQYTKFYDGKLHLVFCDVGQGDGIFVRTPKGIDILVDGGPNNKILECLSRHMPFWDRTIELVFLSHPHADHLTGLISLSKYYKIETFITEALKNKTVGYSTLLQSLSLQNVKIHYVYAGDKFKTKDKTEIKIVGPTKDFLLLSSPGGFIAETGEFASLETLITYKDFSALLTGDSQKEELQEAVGNRFGKVNVLQVPHHGSRTGLDEEILRSINPKLAVISVGKNNKYGHPAPFILDLLKSKNIKTFRTDQSGEMEIVSDGKSWRVTK